MDVNYHLPKLVNCGYVYVVQEFPLQNENNHDDLIVKIGRAIDPKKRFSKHDVFNPRKLQVIKTVLVNNVNFWEKQCHQRFKKFRIRGEWFRIPKLCCFLTLEDDHWWKEFVEEDLTTAEEKEIFDSNISLVKSLRIEKLKGNNQLGLSQEVIRKISSIKYFKIVENKGQKFIFFPSKLVKKAIGNDKTYHQLTKILSKNKDEHFRIHKNIRFNHPDLPLGKQIRSIGFKFTEFDNHFKVENITLDFPIQSVDRSATKNQEQNVAT